MLGLGMQEIAILVVLGVLLFGVPIGIILLVLILRRSQGGGRIAELQARVNAANRLGEHPLRPGCTTPA